MGRLTLAAANMHVRLRDPEANLARIREFVREAADRGVDFLVFPEMAYQGYRQRALMMTDPAREQKQYYRRTAESIPGPLTGTLGVLAREHGMYIQIGMAEQALHGEVLYNSAVIVGPRGIEAVYRKTHNRSEYLFFDAGHDLPVARLPWGTVAPCICYDIVFPEVNRVQAIKGAHLVAVSTAWSMRGKDPASDYHGYCYDIMTRANAMFNQVWLVSSNHAERREDVWYCGHSRIVAPDGTIVAEAAEQEQLVVVDVDLPGELTRARTDTMFGNCFLRDRRPQLYQLVADADIYYPRAPVPDRRTEPGPARKARSVPASEPDPDPPQAGEA